ncbi:MAG: septal ring lytic transglycosylase RlpA family protein [Flavipsychrobacter sp.]|nr:septal ring lytic transglycosylase RlpA family protein [Flavipsychrobacter sp.]
MRRVLLFTFLSFSIPGLKAQDIQRQVTVSESEKGVASYYHDKFEGRKTSTGDVFDNDKFTAASNKIKLGSYVKVTNISNGEVVYVKINDRMAAGNKRLIDLASIAAKKLDFHKKGITKVKVDIVSEDEGRSGILAQRIFDAHLPKNEL